MRPAGSFLQLTAISGRRFLPFSAFSLIMSRILSNFTMMLRVCASIALPESI